MTRRIPLYQIDAFANAPLKGNPAAVMPVDAFLPDDVMQAIAAENNLAETAFIVQTSENSWDLRWFTPEIEVPLCGHATLASAHALFEHIGFSGDVIHFDTKSGRLSVSRLEDGQLEMDFPSSPPQPVDMPQGLVEALDATPLEVWASGFILAVFENADQIRALSPDIPALKNVSSGLPGDRGNVICAATGDNGYDVVSRVFAPGSGIPEDPATGSAHCIIAPLFANKLGRNKLKCFQAYPGRGGDIETEVVGDRVKLRGNAVTIMEGVFFQA